MVCLYSAVLLAAAQLVHVRAIRVLPRPKATNRRAPRAVDRITAADPSSGRREMDRRMEDALPMLIYVAGTMHRPRVLEEVGQIVRHRTDG